MKSLSHFLAAGIVLALSQIASATPVTQLVKTGATTISGVNYNIYQLQVTTSTTWTNQHLTLNLTQGSIFEDTGSLAPTNYTQPNPAYFVSPFLALDPTLQYTTFVTEPTGFPNTSAQGTIPGIAGNVNPTSTSLYIDWNAPSGTTNAPGTYVVAQLTLTSNAVGTFSGTAWDLSDAGATQPNYSGTISAVPEPASLAVLGLGAVAFLATKRRRA